MEAEPGAAGEEDPRVQPSLAQLALCFAQVTLSSFGGGIAGWMFREMVLNRRWLTEREFLTDLGMCQALPGVNVVNLSLWIGYRRDGPFGALVCALAVLGPPAAMLSIAAAAVSQLVRFPAAQAGFEGAAAAAVGLTLSTAFMTARHSTRRARDIATMAATFVAVGVFRLPMLPVMLVVAPCSIAAAAWARRDA